MIGIDGELKIRVDPSLQPYRELSRLDGSPLRIDPGDPLLADLKVLIKQRKTAV